MENNHYFGGHVFDYYYSFKHHNQFCRQPDRLLSTERGCVSEIIYTFFIGDAVGGERIEPWPGKGKG
jgi:hypothetical protein